MKTRILSLALAILMLAAVIPLSSTPALAADSLQFSGGSGTETDPYIITTAKQLADLATEINKGDSIYYDKSYRLGNDINLSAYGKNHNDGKGWIPIDGISGTFDGDGHIITGLYINSTYNGRGLFASIGGGGTVKNLGVVGVNIKGESKVGGVAGEVLHSGSIINCYTTGTVTGGKNVGGIVGSVSLDRNDNSNRTVSIGNCHSAAIVNGNENVGGVVGCIFHYGSTISNCYSTGAISGKVNVGGVVGWVSMGLGMSNFFNNPNSILNSYATGTVNGQYAVGGVVGSLSVGMSGAINIENCYSKGDVSAIGTQRDDNGDIWACAGGVAGEVNVSDSGSINIFNCYSAGNVSGKELAVGGITGFVNSWNDASIKITDCYAAGAVNGDNIVGGLFGYIEGSNGTRATNCAALNLGVICKNDGGAMGRVAGMYWDGILSGNRANRDMDGDFFGENTHDSFDGEDVIMQDALTSSFWTTDTKTWTDWDTTVWLIEDGKLPELKNMPELVEDPEPPQEAPNLSAADGWAQSGIQRAYEKGFIPNDLQGNYKNVITRAEFCRMAVQWVEYRTGKTIDAVIADKGLTVRQDAFSDTKDPYILAAYTLGITSGTVAPTATTSGQFTPDGEFNRQQAAVMIMNTCKVIGIDTTNPPISDFTDLNDADSWARTGINFVRANRIMGGTSTDPLKPTFNPKGVYTRQESIVTFNNIK